VIRAENESAQLKAAKIPVDLLASRTITSRSSSNRPGSAPRSSGIGQRRSVWSIILTKEETIEVPYP